MAAPVEVIVIGDGNRVQMQICGGPVVEERSARRKTGWENEVITPKRAKKGSDNSETRP